MIRQYLAQRCRSGINPLRVGVIAAGSIYYLQDDVFRPYGARPVCRNPWIVESFLNGVVTATKRDRRTGRWMDIHFAGRSDVAVVRSLRDGRRLTVAVRTLILHDDHGFAREPTTYPTLPDLKLYRASARHAPHARAA